MYTIGVLTLTELYSNRRFLSVNDFKEDTWYSGLEACLILQNLKYLNLSKMTNIDQEAHKHLKGKVLFYSMLSRIFIYSRHRPHVIIYIMNRVFMKVIRIMRQNTKIDPISIIVLF